MQTTDPRRVRAADTPILILLQALHHHPDFWDEPDAFRPERRAQPRVHSRHLAELYLPNVLAAVAHA